MKTQIHTKHLVIAVLISAITILQSAVAQTTAFTYQGRLDDAGNPATGSYDIRFILHGDAVLTGFEVGLPQIKNAVAVSDGLFTTIVDFGGAFDSQPRWLELAVKPAGSPDEFTVLSPRQPVTVAPKAVYANYAATLTSALNEGLLPASSMRRYVNETVTGLYHFSPLVGSPPFTVNSSVLVPNLNADKLDGLEAADFWKTGGNVGTTPSTHFLGTTDAQPFELRVQNQRVLRLEPSGELGLVNVIGGSELNEVINGADGATIAGGGRPYPGDFNSIGGDLGFIGGGRGNSVTVAESVVTGGRNNTAAAFNASIGGGFANTASGNYATVPGGSENSAAGTHALAAGRRAKGNHTGTFVWADSTDEDFASTGNNQFLIRAGGGVGINTASPSGSALAVNGDMRVNGNLSTFFSSAFELRLGTRRALRLEPNIVYDTINVIAGSPLNRVEGDVIGATIAGGGGLDAVTFLDYGNRVTGNYGTVGGGWQNLAAVAEATVAGGRANTAGQLGSTVSGGYANSASGAYATIPGGRENAALANYTFAAGRRAKANHTGSFVWADSQNADFVSTADNQFIVRAASGVGINTTSPQAPLHVWGRAIVNGADQWDVNNNEGDFRVGSATHRFKIGVAQTGGGAGDVWMRAHGGTARLILKAPGGTTLYSNETQTSGVTLVAGGGAWTTVSDLNTKENFASVDTLDVLEKVASLPLTSWNYKSQDAEIRHLGPMAQDFKAAFGLGESDTGITTVDVDGVALAAIQGLNAKVENSDRDVDIRIKKLEQENTALKTRLVKLEQLIEQQLNGGAK